MKKEKACRGCGEIIKNPYSSTQQVCGYPCYKKWQKTKQKTALQKLRKQSGLENDRLRRKADALFQEANKKLKPVSILSGKPTEVIHHRIKKSESNFLRYYMPNGVPLTNDEHDAIHKRGKSLEIDIDAKMGSDWTQDLADKRKTRQKLTDEYLEEVISNLKAKL